MPVDENYYETKNQVIKAERRILKELGFCIHFKHPHKVRLLISFCSLKTNIFFKSVFDSTIEKIMIKD